MADQPLHTQAASALPIGTSSDAARHPYLAEREYSALLVVDVQEAFRTHIHEFAAMAAHIKLLIAAFDALNVPIAFSEQYPKGLGPTVSELRNAAPGAPCFDKVEISSVEAPKYERLPARFRSRKQMIICGIETHVCVNQTVHGLLAAGKQVHVVADAVGSHTAFDRDTALARLARAGAIITTTEMVLFELLRVAGTPEFKAVQQLIKDQAGVTA